MESEFDQENQDLSVPIYSNTHSHVRISYLEANEGANPKVGRRIHKTATKSHERRLPTAYDQRGVISRPSLPERSSQRQTLEVRLAIVFALNNNHAASWFCGGQPMGELVKVGLANHTSTNLLKKRTCSHPKNMQFVEPLAFFFLSLIL